VRDRAEATPARLAEGPGFALYALMDFVVDNYMPIVDYLKASFERLEADIFHERADREAIGRLYELRRRMLTLRNAAAPLRDVCNQLMTFHYDIVPREMAPYFRDVHDHVTRVIEAIDSMMEMLAAAAQVHLALVSVRQNDAVKRLAGWGAMLAVPTVIFSLYGMNFRHMPELQWAGGYPAVLGVTALVCVLLYRSLRRGGWL